MSFDDLYEYMLSELKKRDYRHEYDSYQKKPKQRKRNNDRHRARYAMEKKGKVKKGDGKDVHHKDRNTSNNDLKNLGITSQSYNRSRNK